MANILVVDDEPDVLEFQKALFRRKNHNVTTASNTSEALRIIRNEDLDIVFCDLKLDHDASGLDILEQAKKIKPALVFYLISGFVDKETEEKGLKLGAKEVLSKPIKNDKLEEKVRELSHPA